MVDYTPPSRSARHDVPAYADLADLQLLFKRFANRAAGAFGDDLVGDYTVDGAVAVTGSLSVNGLDVLSNPVVRKTGAFSVSQAEARAATTFICTFSATTLVTVPSVTGLADGTRFSVIQFGSGIVQLSGVTVTGNTATSGQFQRLDCVLSAGDWISTDGPMGPTGATGPAPIGGSAGQILTKLSSTEGDIGWSTASNGVPAGGASGEVLAKNSSDDGDVDWVSFSGVSGSLPLGGAAGDILVKQSSDAGDADWITLIPDQTGNADKVLSTDGTNLVWIDAPSGGYNPGTGGDYVATAGSITGGDTTFDYSEGTYTYRVHRFVSTGTTLQLNVTEPVIGKVLIVGAGGGAGRTWSYSGGGGGAGSMYENDYALGTGLHNITIGVGGGETVKGGDTRMDDIIAHGGGGGGNAQNSNPATNGGSGGGAESRSATPPGTKTGGSLDGGATTRTDVFRCSDGQGASYHLNGGNGGGAGGIGAGFVSTITGAAVNYAVGGGQGQAGGGNAGANTGSGGNSTFNGFGSGANGVVIVRYRIA